MKRLKAFSVKKFTLDGRKYHTLTILSAQYLLRVGLLLTQLGLTVCTHGIVAVTELNSKKNLKNLSLLHQRRSYNSISDPNANVVILDSTSQDGAVFHCITLCLSPGRPIVFLWNDVGLSQLVQYQCSLCELIFTVCAVGLPALLSQWLFGSLS